MHELRHHVPGCPFGGPEHDVRVTAVDLSKAQHCRSKGCRARVVADVGKESPVAGLQHVEPESGLGEAHLVQHDAERPLAKVFQSRL